MTEAQQHADGIPPSWMADEYINQFDELVSVYDDDSKPKPGRFAYWKDGKWETELYRDVLKDMVNLVLMKYPNSKTPDTQARAVMTVMLSRIRSTLITDWDVSTNSIPLSDGSKSICTAGDGIGEIIDTPKADKMLKRLPVSSEKLQEAKREFTGSDLEGFLNDWLVFGGNTDRYDYVQMALGQALAGNPATIFMLWIGKGRNGKSQMLNFAKTALGDYCITLDQEYYTLNRYGSSKHPEGLTGLRYARLAVVGELESPETMLAGGVLKTHTGGDPIRVRGMGQNSVEIVPHSMFVIVGNHQPEMQDKSIGIKERLKYLKFEYRIPDEDILDKNRMRQIVDKEKHLMLHWMLEGLKSYGLRNRIDDTGLVRKDTDDYFDQEDQLKDMMNEMCVRETSCYVLASELWKEMQLRKYRIKGINSKRTLIKELRNSDEFNVTDPGDRVVRIKGLKLIKVERKDDKDDNKPDDNVMTTDKLNAALDTFNMSGGKK